MSVGRYQAIREALLAVHRKEFIPTLLMLSIWGLTLNVRTHARLELVALAILINLLLLLSVQALNAAADSRADCNNPLKQQVAQGVAVIGQRAVWHIALLEMALGLLLSLILSLQIHSWLVFCGVAGFLVAALLYDLEPMRLKRRGLWGPTMLALYLGFSPGFIGCIVVFDSLLPFSTWLMLCGVTLAAYGRACWASIADTPEDRVAGLQTPSVHYGPHTTMRLAIGCLILATLLLLWGGSLLFGLPLALCCSAGTLASGLWMLRIIRQTSTDEQAILLLQTRSTRIQDLRLSQLRYACLLFPGLALFLWLSFVGPG